MSALGGLGALLFACIEPPPKIASIPPQGLAVRVHVFGAQAQEARGTFQEVRKHNQQFKLVNEGGDGEILVGLENDSPKCVAPTALCSYKVSYRIKDRKGDVVASATTSVSASSDKCNDLCAKALVNVVTKLVETAAPLLASGASDEGGVDPSEAGAPTDPPDGGAPSSSAAPASASTASSATSASAAHASAKKKPSTPPPGRSDAIMCAVGTGPRLPSEEAERRAAQVEALKRQNILEQSEYDCLRKAYLNRL